MVGCRTGFIVLCKSDGSLQDFISYITSSIRKLCAHTALDYGHVLNVMTKMINSNRAAALQHKLLKAFLEDIEASDKDLRLQSEVR